MCEYLQTRLIRHVLMYVRMHLSLSLSLSLCLSLSLSLSLFLSLSLSLVCVCVRERQCTRLGGFIGMCVYIYVYVCVYIRIHTHIYGWIISLMICTGYKSSLYWIQIMAIQKNVYGHCAMFLLRISAKGESTNLFGVLFIFIFCG